MKVMINEAEIIMGLKQNDQRLQTQFFNAYYGRLKRFVMSRSQKFDNDDIDMIVSSSLTRVFRYINSYKGKCALDSWVLVITRNTMTDYARSKNGNKYKSIYYTDPVLLSQVNSHYEHYHVNDVEVVLDKFLDTLKPKERTIMVSRSQGDKLKDIAKEVGIAENTVKWYVSYLVKDFKDFITIYQ
jgi:RNA polymerase sigma factor (sigma-70 family)